MIQLVVAGQVYNFPSPNDPPNWGEEVTDWAQAVTDALTAVFGPNDIAQTISPINNTGTLANVIGLFFDPTQVRSAIVEYSIYRASTGGGATELAETGVLYLTYFSVANRWDIANSYGGNANITFTMTPGGQLQYTATPITGTVVSSTIHFSAKAFAQ